MTSKRKATLALLAALGMILPGFGAASVSNVSVDSSARQSESARSVRSTVSTPSTSAAAPDASANGGRVDSGPARGVANAPSAPQAPTFATWISPDEIEIEDGEDSLAELAASSPPTMFARLSRPGSDAVADVIARLIRVPRGPPSV